MKKTILAGILFLLSFTVILTVPAAASATPAFSDVKGHWAEKDIQTAVAKGIVAGYPNGTFKPNGTITRAEAAGMLSRVTKLAPENTSEAFSDLEKHWSRDQVRKLVALGFIDPADYKKGFEPDKPVTRYEVMKWIASGLAKSNPDFAQALIDTKDTLLPTPESFKGGISPEQVPYIALVRGTEIIQGFEDGTMRPANTTTRAEVAAIMLRYEKVEGTDPKQYRALNELREVGLTGSNMTSVTNFRYMITSDINPSFRGIDFTGVRDKPITGRNGYATKRVHRMIFTPLEGSVYFDLFVFPDAKAGMEKTNGRSVFVFEEISFTSHVDRLDSDRYRGEFSNGTLLARSSLPIEFAKEKGFNTEKKVYPKVAMDADFIKKGETIKIWLYTSVSKDEWDALPTDDGSTMYITYEE
jgi:hypothetical protein